MIFDVDDLTPDLLEQAAKEALTQPSDSAMWDERLYTTHGAVMSWAVNGDDLIEESNYLKVLEYLQGVAGDDADEHVIDGTVSHWAVGPMRQMFVQVRGDDGDYTEVFREATATALALRDEYPIFDESDYSQREFTRWQGEVTEAVSDAIGDGEGSAKLDAKLTDVTITLLQEDGALDYLTVPEQNVILDAYRRARDAHYTALGVEQLNAQIDGQLRLAL